METDEGVEREHVTAHDDSLLTVATWFARYCDETDKTLLSVETCMTTTQHITP